MNIENLEKEMKEKKISDGQVAAAIKVNLSTWYRRKASPNSLKIGEIIIIKDLLKLTDEKASSIFLN